MSSESKRVLIDLRLPHRVNTCGTESRNQLDTDTASIRLLGQWDTWT